MVVKRMRTDLVTNWACVGFPMTTDGEGILHATIIHNFPPPPGSTLHTLIAYTCQSATYTTHVSIILHVLNDR